MINQLALNLVADVMDWDNEVATREYGWLRLISSMKYDGYSDFRAGVRFLESLVSWLRHFDKADRPAAYAFVKERLVYISTLEMQRVIETFIPEIVTPYLGGRSPPSLESSRIRCGSRRPGRRHTYADCAAASSSA